MMFVYWSIRRSYTRLPWRGSRDSHPKQWNFRSFNPGRIIVRVQQYIKYIDQPLSSWKSNKINHLFMASCHYSVTDQDSKMDQYIYILKMIKMYIIISHNMHRAPIVISLIFIDGPKILETWQQEYGAAQLLNKTMLKPSWYTMPDCHSHIVCHRDSKRQCQVLYALKTRHLACLQLNPFLQLNENRSRWWFPQIGGLLAKRGACCMIEFTRLEVELGWTMARVRRLMFHVRHLGHLCTLHLLWSLIRLDICYRHLSAPEGRKTIENSTMNPDSGNVNVFSSLEFQSFLYLHPSSMCPWHGGDNPTSNHTSSHKLLQSWVHRQHCP